MPGVATRQLLATVQKELLAPLPSIDTNATPHTHAPLHPVTSCELVTCCPDGPRGLKECNIITITIITPPHLLQEVHVSQVGLVETLQCILAHLQQQRRMRSLAAPAAIIIAARRLNQVCAWGV